MKTKQLQDILNGQQVILKNFLETVKIQQRALIENDTDKLEESIKIEVKILNNLSKIHSERQLVVKKLAEENNLFSGTTDIDEIIKNTEPSESNEILKQQQMNIKKIVLEIERINLLNKTLIESGRNFIRETILGLVGEKKNPLLDRRM